MDISFYNVDTVEVKRQRGDWLVLVVEEAGIRHTIDLLSTDPKHHLEILQKEVDHV